MVTRRDVNLSEAGEPEAFQLRNASDLGFVFPVGFSFFEPYLQYFVKETLGVGGEAYVSIASDGAISGVFLYDDSEKAGTIYTRSRRVFDRFYKMKPFDFLFSEMKTEYESEIYDIYTIDLENLAIVHRFNHEISIAEEEDAGAIEQFTASTQPGTNKRWVNVALDDGDKCFIVRLGKEIAGLGWLSVVNGVGRLHSLDVKPQFRRIGIGEDILFARLFWLRSKHARSAFSEISRSNSPSSRIAVRGQMKPSRQIFQYFRKSPNRKAGQGTGLSVPRF